MKVDIISLKELAYFEKNIVDITNDINKKIKTLENMIMQLQDRIGILERGEK